jgi:hypothetical protein
MDFHRLGRLAVIYAEGLDLRDEHVLLLAL